VTHSSHRAAWPWRAFLEVWSCTTSVITVPRGCVTARQPSPTLSEHRSCPSPDMSQIPLLNAWPGGLLCPWTPGGRWTPWHAERAPGASGRANEAGHACTRRPWPARVPGWLVERLRLGSGMPAPSGQIPPPRAWWENEAPATRAARRPVPGSPRRLFLHRWVPPLTGCVGSVDVPQVPAAVANV